MLMNVVSDSVDAPYNIVYIQCDTAGVEVEGD